MGNLTAFLAQNAKQVENVKLVVSDRFTDEDGKPLEWEVRCISSREDETLRRDCPVRLNTVAVRVFRNAARRPTVAAAGRLFSFPVTILHTRLLC